MAEARYVGKIDFKLPNLTAIEFVDFIFAAMGVKSTPLKTQISSLEARMAKRNILVSYKKHESMNDYSCFYCGAHGESKDHAPAVSHAHDYPNYDRILVRCCLLCNGLLGARFLPTLYQRANYLSFKFKKRFKKLIEMPNWNEEEIDELSGKLKSSIRISMKRKRDVILRIKKLEELVDVLIPDEVFTDELQN